MSGCRFSMASNIISCKLRLFLQCLLGGSHGNLPFGNDKMLCINAPTLLYSDGVPLYTVLKQLVVKLLICLPYFSSFCPQELGVTETAQKGSADKNEHFRQKSRSSMLNRRYFLKTIENCWSTSRDSTTNIDIAAMNKMALSTYNPYQRHNTSKRNSNISAFLCKYSHFSVYLDL